jgi:uncharacterized protein YndB with AHSA1/START domain
MTEHRCRDERVVPAPIDRCFALLADLATWARWWTLVTVTPNGPDTRLVPGMRFRFTGGDVSWPVRVLEVIPSSRIELAYAGEEYLGATAWELDAAGIDATRVAYVYRGVRPASAHAEAHFARWGTRLHSVAMQEDALAGLVRLAGGPGSALDDGAWRRDVRRRVAAGIAALA